jgi:hypothetical protein
MAMQVKSDGLQESQAHFLRFANGKSKRGAATRAIRGRMRVARPQERPNQLHELHQTMRRRRKFAVFALVKELREAFECFVGNFSFVVDLK